MHLDDNNWGDLVLRRYVHCGRAAFYYISRPPSAVACGSFTSTLGAWAHNTSQIKIFGAILNAGV